MNQSNLQLLAALIATLILYVSLSLLNISAVFLVFSATPLMALGLSGQLKSMLIASTICAFLLLFLDPAATILFITYLALPTILLCPQLLLKRNGTWYPVGLALTDLAIYTALCFLALEFSLTDSGGILGAISTMMEQAGDKLDPEVIAHMGWLVDNGQYILISIAVWWSVLIFYLALSLSNIFLVSRNLNLRPNLALQPFLPPLWILGLLVACAGFGMITQETPQFIARTLFLIFLLPYFLSGAMYSPLRTPNGGRRLWLFLVYFFTLMLAWPALIIAGVGIWQHCKLLFSQKN